MSSAAVSTPVPPAPEPTLASTAPPAPIADSSPLPVDTLNDGIDIGSIPEHIGYLKECGLDFGFWGPTSKVMWMLEHVHVYTGFPWWASIFTTALIFRIACLPLFIKQSEMAAKFAAIRPEIESVKVRMATATATGDRMAQRVVIKEQQDMMKAVGIKYRWMVVPMVVNAVLGIGTFRLTRAAADLPVPSWETGGVLWLQDLTVSDPYYVTPVLFGGIMHLFVRLGGDSGASTPQQEWLKPVMLYVMPTFMAGAMFFMPVGMHFSFLASLGFGIIQSLLLRNSAVRGRLGLPPLVTNAAAATTNAQKAKPATPYPPGLNIVIDSRKPHRSAPAPPKALPVHKRTLKTFSDGWKDARTKLRQWREKWSGEALEGGPGRRKRTKTFTRSADEYEKRRREEVKAERASRL